MNKKLLLVFLAGTIAGHETRRFLTTSLFPEYESCWRCRGLFETPRTA